VSSVSVVVQTGFFEGPFRLNTKITRSLKHPICFLDGLVVHFMPFVLFVPFVFNFGTLTD